MYQDTRQFSFTLYSEGNRTVQKVLASNRGEAWAAIARIAAGYTAEIDRIKYNGYVHVRITIEEKEWELPHGS